jgi:hypothetical protein
MQIKNLSLLQAKIAELRTALFFCDSQYALPYASYLVEVLKMDDQGSVWFYIKKQNGQGVERGELFPVSLEFYRKGVPYTIDIKGMACITNDTMEDNLLIKIDIDSLQYKEFIDPNSVPAMETIGKVFKNLFYIPEPMDEYVVAE